MASSPSHQLGENIGIFLEDLTKDILSPLAKKHGMYLDFKHPRKARSNLSEIEITDISGNKHKLDFVFERNGSEEHFGENCAFIEVAWRRYTKHSKNKAQEISGAIKPIIDRFHRRKPFYGALLAGEFTANSLRQLRSEGFGVLYIPFSSIQQAFLRQNFNIYWDEETSREDLKAINDNLFLLPQSTKEKVKNLIKEMHKDEISVFIAEIERSILKSITKVIIASYSGSISRFTSIDSACNYLSECLDTNEAPNQLLFRIEAEYNNGDKISFEFTNRREAICELRSLI